MPTFWIQRSFHSVKLRGQFELCNLPEDRKRGLNDLALRKLLGSREGRKAIVEVRTTFLYDYA